MYSFRVLAYVLLMAAVSSCATIDKGMMSVSDAVSSKDPVTGQRQVSLVSERQEISSAEARTQQILADASRDGVTVDGDHYEQVLRVFDRLVQVAHRSQLPWEVHVLDKDQFNAFTIGGGKVFVYSGLFHPDIGVRTDDELAAVLAHEIAHVAARHGTESQSQLAITKLASKSLREGSYEAAFTTIQEDEADRFSVIYSALAGYNPRAGIEIWKRLHSASGSYTGNMLYDHPLPDDRARNLASYAALAEQYYTPGTINPGHNEILKNNEVFAYKENTGPAAGEGGGLVALLEATANTYSGVLEAQHEQANRKKKQREQRQQAARCLKFQNLEIAPAQSGGQGLFGTVINAAQDEIRQATIVIEYRNGQAIVRQDRMSWPSMRVNERRRFGIALKQLQYTSVSILPVYVQLAGE